MPLRTELNNCVGGVLQICRAYGAGFPARSAFIRVNQLSLRLRVSALNPRPADASAQNHRHCHAAKTHQRQASRLGHGLDG